MKMKFAHMVKYPPPHTKLGGSPPFKPRFITGSYTKSVEASSHYDTLTIEDCF